MEGGNAIIDSITNNRHAGGGLIRSQSSSYFFESENVMDCITKFLSRYGHAMWQFFLVFMFYFVGIIYYKQQQKGWSILDCAYFITVTTSTVGYGDFYPTNDRDRLFTAFFIIVGIIFVFSAINEFAKYIMDLAEQQSSQKLQRTISQIEKTPSFKYNFRLLKSILIILAVLILGATFYSQNEDWSFAKAFYFSVVTTTTVGYGDLSPKKDTTKIFSIFYILISVIMVANALGTIASIQYEKEAEEKKLQQLRRKLDFAMIRELDKDGNGVDKFEFVIGMLSQLGIVDKEKDVDPWVQKFDEIDKDHSGTLDAEDIAILEKEEEDRQRFIAMKVAQERESERKNSWHPQNIARRLSVSSGTSEVSVSPSESNILTELSSPFHDAL